MTHHKSNDDVNDLQGSDEGDDFNLFDLLPEEVANHPACCDSRRYDEWENDIAAPALLSLGYVASGWHTIDGDSFGPLVRGVTLTKDGKRQIYTYG